MQGPGQVLINNLTTSSNRSCTGDCQFKYVFKTNLLLISKPGDDAFFREWSGACSGREPCELTLNGEEVRVSAVFEKIKGSFTASLEQDFIVVPKEQETGIWISFYPDEDWNVPSEALEVHLSGWIIGDAVDQVNYHYEPKNSTRERLFIRLVPGQQVPLRRTEPINISVGAGKHIQKLDAVIYITECGSCTE